MEKKKMRGPVKALLLAVLYVLILWFALGAVDYFRVHSFEKPVFCLLTKGNGDGGSGRYVGPGYSFAIKGNFASDAEYPGVTEYTWYVFGAEMSSGVRD